MSQDNATLGIGGPRSQATRRSILEAARATFATRGYEQTTIRAVAAKAGIDPSMIMRYFGSKAGLFTAASTIDLHPPDLAAVPARRRGEHMVRHFVDRWEASSTDETLVFLMRTAVTNEAVANQMQATFDALILEPITALDHQNAGERAALIGSQMLGLVLCRYVLRLEPLVSLPVDDIVARIAPTIQRYLTQPPNR